MLELYNEIVADGAFHDVWPGTLGEWTSHKRSSWKLPSQPGDFIRDSLLPATLGSLAISYIGVQERD